MFSLCYRFSCLLKCEPICSADGSVACCLSPSRTAVLCSTLSKIRFHWQTAWSSELRVGTCSDFWNKLLAKPAPSASKKRWTQKKSEINFFFFFFFQEGLFFLKNTCSGKINSPARSAASVDATPEPSLAFRRPLTIRPKKRDATPAPNARVRLTLAITLLSPLTPTKANSKAVTQCSQSFKSMN